MLLLGHLVSENGIEADPGKVESLLLRDPPTTAKELASFVHKLRYLSRFIWMLGQYVQPLEHMLRKFQNFKWSERGLQAFEAIKGVLCTLPILLAPNWGETFYVSFSVGDVSYGL